MSQALAIIEDETPKSVFKQFTRTPGLSDALARLGFVRGTAPVWTRGHWTIEQHQRQTANFLWFICCTIEGHTSTMAYGGGEEELLSKLRTMGFKEGQPIAEAEDPKHAFKAISAAAAFAPDKGKEVSGAWIRTICARYPAQGVYIWKVDDFPRCGGILQINFRNYGLVRQLWMSFGSLASALLRWRNLEGAPLWINGEPCAKVSRSHPQLKALEDAAYRPHGPGRQQEAEDPKDIFRRISAKATEPGAEVSFGFAIQTRSQEHIEDVAEAAGVALDAAAWETLNADILALERNCLKTLNKSGIRTQDEGHDARGDLVGTAWANLNTPGWDIVKRWADTNGQILCTACEVESTLRPASQILWQNVSAIGKTILDVQLEFFALEGLLSEARKPVPPTTPGKEDPKDIFRRMGAFRTDARTKAYDAVLEYMPQEFKEAYAAKEFYEWKQDDDRGLDVFPTYDDDDAEAGRDPWSEVAYYFNYCTEGGKIFIFAMARDSDGDHELCGAEVGTPPAAEIEKEYGLERWRTSMIEYWEWVRDHGKDPLNFIHVPNVEVKHEWLAGFVRHGEKLRLAALRQLTAKKPSPPAVLWPEVKAKAEDPAWKEALDYCLVDDEGVTEATEQDIVKEGGKWDSKTRLVLKFTITSKQAGENARERIVAQAAAAIQSLQTAV